MRALLRLLAFIPFAAAAQHQDAVDWYLDLLLNNPEQLYEMGDELDPDEAFAVAEALIARAPPEATELELVLGRLQAIPPSIARLQNLQTLESTSLELGDLSALAQLPALADLTLYSLEITDLGAIPHPERIERLSLIGARLTTLDGLARFTSLSVLALQGAEFAGVVRVPPNLASLDLTGSAVAALDTSAGCALHAVSIAVTAIDDLGPLSACAELAFLHMWITPITSLEPLSALAGLVDISAGDSGIQDLRGFGAQKDLYWLDLSDTPLKSIEGIERLEALTNLYLYRVSSELDLSALPNLPNLEDVGLPDDPDPAVVEALRAKGVTIRFSE